MSKMDPYGPKAHAASHAAGGSDAVSVSAAWPVGSVFLSVVSTNPGTLLGFGTWSAFGAGKMLVGLDSGDADFDTAEETGGAKTITLEAANIPELPVTITDPGHQHGEGYRNTTSAGTAGVQGAASANNANIANGVQSNTTGITAKANNGVSASAKSVLNPYIVVYMWKRTA